MKASTINATTFKLFRLNADGTASRVAGAVTYSQTSKMAFLNPNSKLRLGATYKARDLASNALDQDGQSGQDLDVHREEGLGDRQTQDLIEAGRQTPRLFSTSVLHLHRIARDIFSEVVTRAT
jgi:hypothetical protein